MRCQPAVIISATTVPGAQLVPLLRHASATLAATTVINAKQKRRLGPDIFAYIGGRLGRRPCKKTILSGSRCPDALEKSACWCGHLARKAHTSTSLGVRERKPHRHLHTLGIVPGLGGWQKLFLCFLGSFLMGKKNTQTTFPHNPAKILFMRLCFLFIFRFEGRWLENCNQINFRHVVALLSRKHCLCPAYQLWLFPSAGTITPALSFGHPRVIFPKVLG